MTPSLQITILGAGLMGSGIAHAFAAGGHAVTLFDISPERLESARQAVRESAGVFVESGQLSAGQAEALQQRITFQPDLEASLATPDIVVEAASESPAVKTEIFKQAASLAPPTAVVWSNTSSLDVFELAPPELQSRLLIAHWFAPAHILPLVELVPGPSTDMRHLEAAERLLADLGKTPVKLERYVPGFIINRLLRALGREAFYLVDNGYITAEGLDQAVKASLAPRMMVLGIMQRYDFTGLDLSARNFKNDKFVDAPVDLAPRALMERVENGHLGVKTGKGFYDYGGMSVHEASRRRDERLLSVLNACAAVVSNGRSV